MRPGHIEIFVKNPLLSMAFYRDVLGFEVKNIQQEKFVWLSKDGYTVLLRPGENKLQTEEYKRTNKAVCFYTDNLDETLKQLSEKGLQLNGCDGSEKCPTFTDPDGNWFQLVNPQEQ